MNVFRRRQIPTTEVASCIALAITAAVGCGGPQRVDRHDTATPSGAPFSVAVATAPQTRLLDGPPCGPHGPTIEMTAAPSSPAKPPLRIAMMDARIKNPLPTAVWLLYRLGGRRLPTVVADLSLSKSETASQAPVWRFSGDGAFRGLRIPAGAGLSVRGVELSSWSDDDPLLVAFASTVQVADRAAETWIGQAGMLEPHGTFGLDAVATQAERHWDNAGAARLEVSVLCVTRAESAAPAAP
jgi:hypothetical protein